MDISSHKALSPRRIATRLALAAAVLMAAGVFAVRGPVYAWNRGADFVLVYGPARALLYGANPYDAADIDRVWAEAGGPFEQRPSTREDGALIYPLTTLAMFAPLAALPWSAAQHAWGLLALLIPYFLNAATALKMIEQKVALPSWLLDAWWWDSLVIPMQAWALPLMAILLIAAREREGRRDDVYGCHDEA